ncbi:hypothetical protein CGA22_00400 [Pseudomonas sp. PSB18]|nr:hypothetical protein [Pseudomonas sp. PSB18]
MPATATRTSARSEDRPRALYGQDLVSCFTNTFLFDECLLSSGKAPRRVIARYGEERQRSMTTTDAVKKEQYL